MNGCDYDSIMRIYGDLMCGLEDFITIVSCDVIRAC